MLQSSADTDSHVRGHACPRLVRGHGRGHGHDKIKNRGHGRGHGHDKIENRGHGRGHGHDTFKSTKNLPR